MQGGDERGKGHRCSPNDVAATLPSPPPWPSHSSVSSAHLLTDDSGKGGQACAQLAESESPRTDCGPDLRQVLPTLGSPSPKSPCRQRALTFLQGRQVTGEGGIPGSQD